MHWMVVFLIVFSCVAFADTGIQTDWSGGPGEEEPVTDWGNSFFSSIYVNWFNDAGNLFLDQLASYDQIREFDDLVWAKPCLLDNDEYPDVFVTDGEGDTKWYHNVSSGSEWGERDFADTPNIEDICTGDIDGDGDYDVFTSVDCYVTHGFFWFERLNPYGTQWDSHEIDTENDPSRVYSLDFDGDGDIDLMGTYNAKSISWWENQSNGQNWVKHVISENTLEHGITSIDVADFDNDGDFDVVCGSSSDEIYLFENLVSDSWIFHGIGYSSEGDFRVVSFADIDGDDLPDLVAGTLSNPTDVLWFRNTTVADNWEAYKITTVPGHAYPARAGDVDGDGDIDVIGRMNNSTPNELAFSWWENIDPLNNQWVCHQILSDEGSGSFAFIEDVNQDGKCDVVSYYRDPSHPYDNKVAWWNLNSGYATGVAQLESSILYVYDVDWGNIDWNATTPDGTSVSFEVRSSDNPEDMGDWSAVITTPGSLVPRQLI